MPPKFEFKILNSKKTPQTPRHHHNATCETYHKTFLVDLHNLGPNITATHLNFCEQLP
jgi:hypothetical protein